MYHKKKKMNAGGKVKKAVGVLSTIANPKAAVVKAVAGNVMGPKGQARRQKRRARRAARKASYMGGRMMYGHGGEVAMEGTQPKYKGTPKCMPN